MTNKGRPMQRHPNQQPQHPPGARPEQKGKGVRRSTKVTIGAVGAIAALRCGGAVVAAFADDDDDDRYCVDATTDVRVDDDDCDDNDGRHRWYYVPSGSKKPSKGVKASGGSYTAPSKGGFGGKSGSGSSGG